ncbi:copper resistance CopC family protein [Cellulomonas cellasea]|uniref:CopC domain-containing protein n=2 Tax=Cellulomonas cellasea TaxID=43670 RepID=A0A0A0B8B3_9CELL|nr:copper resistance CopC family protein [Cellulomonas cellasea]KGM02039.1 hypothetical protein Q760_15785 [Cellulomonas cellasea DSM 20118]GEA87608.1 hypothetical protein CCE01nite_15570 [Cellulomonas cellasea]
MLPHASDRPTALPRTAPGDRRSGVRARVRGSFAVLVATLAAVLAGLALAVLGAGPAAAHSALVSSDPADGSTPATVPAQVTLTFNEPAVALGTVVEVRAPDGRVVSSGDAVLADAGVTQALSGDLPAGTYSVLWRVTSADGHPIEGQLTFTAQGPATAGDVPAASDPATAAATATPTAEPTPAPTPTTAAGAPEATESAEPAERDPAAQASATNTLLAGTVAALAALGVVVAVLIRRRPHGHHGGPGGAATDGSTGTHAGSTGD